MILDIDIRVSNDSGVQVHQFTKHFDSRFEGTRIEGGKGTITKSFEDFLSEFLSGSGRVIRDSLITRQDNSASISTPQTGTDAYGNIEYTLKLGDTQSVSGKIPLDKLFRLSEIARLTTDAKPLYLPESVETDWDSAEFAAENRDDSLILKRLPFQTVDLAEVDRMFQQFITNAVSKYEDSFFVNDCDTTSFIKSS
ncbi:hypothetical protein [Konateibacter massiliensis]|uniref:hypothetical protein n=1 Tax=Konateibacter massiliensis TaxID=2002841 RepID=UPI000C148F48|nr:hypothetical protein [Konateibacter massiliensis]